MRLWTLQCKNCKCSRTVPTIKGADKKYEDYELEEAKKGDTNVETVENWFICLIKQQSNIFFYFVNVNNILNPYLSKLLSGIFFYFIKQSAKKMIKILQKES